LYGLSPCSVEKCDDRLGDLTTFDHLVNIGEKISR